MSAVVNVVVNVNAVDSCLCFAQGRKQKNRVSVLLVLLVFDSVKASYPTDRVCVEQHE